MRKDNLENERIPGRRRPTRVAGDRSAKGPDRSRVREIDWYGQDGLGNQGQRTLPTWQVGRGARAAREATGERPGEPLVADAARRHSLRAEKVSRGFEAIPGLAPHRR